MADLVASAMKPTKGRTAAPGELTVEQLQMAFEDWFTKENSRDVSGMMAEMAKQVTWKNSPKSAVMARYGPLYANLASLTPGGVLPPKKTTLALMACHAARPINFSGRRDQDWAEDASSLLRAGFGKYRDIVNDDSSYRRCMAKA